MRRFRPTGSVARYEARRGDSHQHPACLACGPITDVDGPVDGTACLAACDGWGFEADDAEVVYWADVPCALRKRRPGLAG